VSGPRATIDVTSLGAAQPTTMRGLHGLRDTGSVDAGLRAGLDLDLAAPPASEGPACFQHESLFYAGEEQFLSGTLPPINDAVELEQPVLVAVSPARISLLRDALGERAEQVGFANMHALGRNPARMIPAWQRFLDQHAPLGRPVVGIGEPIWPGRSAAQLSECRRHELLLNLAFAGGQPWRLLCPYDLDGLDDQVLEAARANHPFIAAAGASERNERYRKADWLAGAFGGDLPKPRTRAQETVFGAHELAAVRGLVARRAGRAQLGAERTQQLVLAVSELASNSVRHSGGGGKVRMWQENATLLCEVQDAGRIQAPLVGRIQPRPEQLTGRGLWLVHQLCDLVQIRSGATGTVIRLHMDLTAPD
jgi:anti-sigma regulatory factor (Ser/Thr protein kinase)